MNQDDAEEAASVMTEAELREAVEIWMMQHPMTEKDLAAMAEDDDVIACIAGRGFKVRREDMRRLLQATDGKVFTLTTMYLLIEHTRIKEYRAR